MNKILMYALAIGALVISGCGKDEEPQPVIDKYDTPYARTKDPEYKAKIKERLQARNELMSRASKLNEELMAERAKDPESARVKEIEAEMKKLSEDMANRRKKDQMMVRDRIIREQNAIKAREAREAAEKAKENNK